MGELLQPLSPVWKTLTWHKTWLPNYVCRAGYNEDGNAAWIGEESCCDDTLNEAYAALAESVGKRGLKLPPLSDFQEEVEAYTPPEEMRAGIRFLHNLKKREPDIDPTPPTDPTFLN